MKLLLSFTEFRDVREAEWPYSVLHRQSTLRAWRVQLSI